MRYQSQTFAGRMYQVMTIGHTAWGASFWLPTVPVDNLFEEKPLSVMSTGRPNRVGDRFCHHYKLEGTISSKLHFDNKNITEGPMQIASQYGQVLTGHYPLWNKTYPMAMPFGASDVIYGIRDTYNSSPEITDRHYKYAVRTLGNMRFACVEYVLSKTYNQSTFEVSNVTGYAWVHYFYPRKYMSASWQYQMLEDSTSSVKMPTPGVEVVDSHDFSYMDPYIDKVVTNLVSEEYYGLKSIKNLGFSPWDYSLYLPASSVPVESSNIDISTWIKRANAVSPPSEREWQELAYEAVQNANYVAINSIAYLKDMPELFGELKALKQVLGNPKDARAWASLILSANYGTRLTIQDTVELINAIIRQARSAHKADKRRFSTLRSRSGYSVTGPKFLSGHRELHYKIYHKIIPEGVMSFIDSLYQWDLLPTAGNIWDLIPYSFVIDWFVNIGDNIELADATLYAQTLKVLGITYSYKDIFQLPPSADGLVINDGKLTAYHRMLSNRISLPSYSLEFNRGYENNIIQGGSLLIQKWK